jgi:HK97 gp10 family phage protein
MGRVVVRYNHFGAIARALPRALGSGMDEFVERFDNELKSRVWRRYGIVAETIQDRDPAALHATISVGLNKARGFYSRFNEWGTIYQSARPVVGPVSLENEPVFVDVMTKHIRRACEAK